MHAVNMNGFSNVLYLYHQDESGKNLTTLKEQLNQVETENQDLRAEIMRLRYSAHPANDHVNSQVREETLKDQVNQLATENNDLKSVVGRMRYTGYPGPGSDSQGSHNDERYSLTRSVTFTFK